MNRNAIVTVDNDESFHVSFDPGVLENSDPAHATFARNEAQELVKGQFTEVQRARVDEYILGAHLDAEDDRLMFVVEQVWQNGIVRVGDLHGKSEREVFEGTRTTVSDRQAFLKAVARLGIRLN